MTFFESRDVSPVRDCGVVEFPLVFRIVVSKLETFHALSQVLLSCTHIDDETALFAQAFISQINHQESGDKVMVVDLDISEVSNHQGCQLLVDFMTDSDIVDQDGTVITVLFHQLSAIVSYRFFFVVIVSLCEVIQVCEDAQISITFC